MPITANIHDSRSFTAYRNDGVTWVSIDHEANVFVYTPAQCDEAIKAFIAAKDMLLGETSAPIDKHGRYDAASAAEVAQGLDVLDGDGDDRDDTDIDARDAAGGVELAGTSLNPTAPGPDCAVPDDRELWFCHECKEFHAPASPLAPPSGYQLPSASIPADGA